MLNLPVLLLNRFFAPVSVTTARRALVLLYGGVGHAVDVAGDTYDFSDWRSQPVRGVDDAQLFGRKGLDVLEQRLVAHQWLALDRPTIADIGCFPYVALASEGEIPLDACPSVRSWIDRVKALPGFVGMPGI